MKTKGKKEQSRAKASEAGLLLLAAAKLKGRNLFPHKTAKAKEYLRTATVASS